MRRRTDAQLRLQFSRRGEVRRGGARLGAGRPKKADAGVSHLRRPSLSQRWPVHVTMRLRRGLPSARRPQMFRAIRGAFEAGRDRLGGRLCHYSVQGDHLHLVVEARDKRALSRAIQGLTIRIAKAINRALGTKGKVFADRYHARILRTPTEVRRALDYVLDNRWKHGNVDPDYFAEVDFCSSASWSDSVVPATTWLLRRAEHERARAGPTRIGTRKRRMSRSARPLRRER